MVAKIDSSTIIDVGIQLSRNFNLSHVTSGAYHPVMARWMPLFTSTLIPDASLPMGLSGGANMPLWKIVANLQAGADGLLEGLLDAFGGDLILKSGFSNAIPFNALPNEIQHLTGMAFDIQVSGVSNIYNAAKEIQNIVGVADELNLVFGGSSSWMHMKVNPLKLGVPKHSLPLPSFTTSDLVNGITEKGLTSIRGFI